jgi:hypothetical protein
MDRSLYVFADGHSLFTTRHVDIVPKLSCFIGVALSHRNLFVSCVRNMLISELSTMQFDVLQSILHRHAGRCCGFATVRSLAGCCCCFLIAAAGIRAGAKCNKVTDEAGCVMARIG